jgi:predicted DNA-binding protein
MDKQEKVRFTMRISQELLDKLGYIAEYYGRTKNKELEQMILSCIRAFESKHGPISIVKED